MLVFLYPCVCVWGGGGAGRGGGITAMPGSYKAQPNVQYIYWWRGPTDIVALLQCMYVYTIHNQKFLLMEILLNIDKIIVTGLTWVLLYCL